MPPSARGRVKQTITKRYFDSRLRQLVEDVVDVYLLTEQLFFDIMEQLLKGNDVYIAGFGRFKVSVRKGKFKNKVTLTQGTGRKGERTGTKTVTIKQKYYVSFKRADAFRRKFNSRFKKKVKTS